MHHHTSHRPFHGFHFGTGDSLKRRVTSTVLQHYLTGGLIAWMIGIQFATGWIVESTGHFDYGFSVLYGAAAVLVVALLKICMSMAHIHLRDVGTGTALAMCLVLIVASFPIGSIVGCIWNSIGGSFPDVSGLGNRDIACFNLTAVNSIFF
jgi:hypothetical protein